MTANEPGNGEITFPAPARISQNKHVEAIRDDPNTPEDMRIILQPKFSTVHKIVEELYLTGMFGLTKENFAEHHIELVINATLECPNLLGIECLRIPVSTYV